jgi:peptidoglycan hydrolase CwlO-like protein
MSAESAILIIISLFSLVFALYSGSISMKRSYKKEVSRESADLTMVIVKLEDISAGISEIKADLSNVKGDVKEITERLIIAEESVKLAHRRIDELRNKS